MRTLALAVVTAASLAIAATAAAGGWATVGVSPPPPDRVDEPWNVTLTVLRHGRTPTDGAKPTITIRNTKTGRTETYAAKPTGEVGKYSARIDFPSSGTWRYEVNNGLAATGYGGDNVQTFAPIEIVSGSGDSGVPAWTLAPAVIAAVGVAGLLWALARRRRPRGRLAPSLN